VRVEVPRPALVRDVDYYVEDGKTVFTAVYHLKRGYCCNSGCRHCPYRADAPPVRLPAIRIIGLPGEDPSAEEGSGD
jgi:hypothetical protein